MPDRSAQSVPSPELAAFAETHLGSGLTYAHRGWDLKVSNVWLVTTPGGVRLYLKQHEEERLHLQDVRASRDWVPHLPPVAPRLIASDPALMAAIFTEVPGRVMSGLELTVEQELEAYRRAGEYASALHALPYEDTAQEDAGEYMLKRMETVCREAQGLVDDATLKWAMDAFGGGGVFKGQKRVPCHRDYSPRNWMITLDGERPGWGVIDFERSYPDFWLQDIQRMWVDQWRTHPPLRDAFLGGYGRDLTDDELHRLRLVSLRIGIGTVTWATRYGDMQFAQFGRDTVEWLKGEL